MKYLGLLVRAKVQEKVILIVARPMEGISITKSLLNIAVLRKEFTTSHATTVEETLGQEHI